MGDGVSPMGLTPISKRRPVLRVSEPDNQRAITVAAAKSSRENRPSRDC